MKQLSKEHTEYAVGRLHQLVQHRGYGQPQLEQLSKVNQSTISKMQFLAVVIDHTPSILELQEEGIGNRPFLLAWHDRVNHAPGEQYDLGIR